MPLGVAAPGALTATPSEFARDKHHIKDGNDDFMLEIIVAGSIRFADADSERVYNSGSAYLVDQQRPRRLIGGIAGSVRNVTVSRAALKALVSSPEDMAAQIVQPGLALRLLDGYLQSLLVIDEPPPAELGGVIAQHLLDLVAAALGPTREAREIVAKRGLKAARLRAALAEIARHYSDPGLDVDGFAGRLGESRRSVQRLLEETGKSFTTHITERRLDHAYAMLSDPAYAHLRIIDIALAAGFGDVSHFNRLFRRRFGDTPSGVRTAVPHAGC
jgi:AraC-like DNA-binding protein